MKPHYLCHTIALTLIASAISCSETGSADETAQQHHKIEPADSPAYYLGRQHAQELMDQCSTTGQIRDRLLDLRAREHIIRSQISGSSADAYIEGVESQLSESGDTLANVIK